MGSVPMNRCLVLFTKPARPGRVKTRLIGDVTAEQAAELHSAFLQDLTARLIEGPFDLELAWDLDPDEPVPAGPIPGVRQQGVDLGERLYQALADAAEEHETVAALGSDHPHIALSRIETAFERLEAGASAVFGPAEDGGYYLVGVRSDALAPELFQGIPWSTGRVLEATLEQCRNLDLEPSLLEQGWDVDRPPDLARLARLLVEEDHGCPRTRALLESWGRLEAS